VSFEVTSKHDDIVIIIATDLAGNKVEKSITVSIKILVQGFVINGETPKSLSGTTVSSAGDVNGDGLDESKICRHSLLLCYK
jgi:hypothetical protein